MKINPNLEFLLLYTDTSLVLLLAALEDYLLGDPWGWLHPVQVMGWVINQYTQLALKLGAPGWQRRLLGVGLGLLLIIGSGTLSWWAIKLAEQIQPLLGLILQVVWLASCYAGKSLRVAVEDVLTPMRQEDLATGRSHLSRYVGRDTADLAAPEIYRALLETVAENGVDGVTAPLFWAISGWCLGVGVVPFAVAYKAASTLDSMVGYRREPYTDLGWFSARLEDCLTWLPCRLTVLTLCLSSGRPLEIWQVCQRDGAKDPSPNSGWSEAAYAAILRVQLGGKNTYQGVVREKPLLGDDLEPISEAKIIQALALTRFCFLSWLSLAIAIYYFSLFILNR
ncbi:MAG: adenosylcobinamide-phosphate synthase CbiB [Cyanobacteria bacterium P01_C01_bin.72]